MKKYDFSKELLSELYTKHGSYSKAASVLCISKSTFRQQYLRSNNLCIVCAKNNDSSIGTCSDCTLKAPEKKPIKKCQGCSGSITRKENQSKLSWSKKLKCDKCLVENERRLSRNHYLKNRKRKLNKQLNSESYKEYQKNYRRSKKGKVKRRVSNAKRRAVKQATATPNVDRYIELLLTDPTSKCMYCKDMKNLSIEHIIPLSRGGTHSEDNIDVACLACNIKKGNKTKEEFIEFLKLTNN